jgi:hypothetical protein
MRFLRTIVSAALRTALLVKTFEYSRDKERKLKRLDFLNSVKESFVQNVSTFISKSSIFIILVTSKGWNSHLKTEELILAME